MTSDNFVIIDLPGTRRHEGEPEVIGEVDFSSALTTVHPKAIYIHQGQQYHVDRLDFDQRKAYVKRVNVDYFTDAIRYTQVRVLEIAEEQRMAGPAVRAHGDVLVRSQVVGFKKIKFFTNENVGAGKLELPENEMHTTSFWITLERKLLAGLPFALSDRQSGIFGLLYALESMATLLLMCDRRDIGTAVGERPASPGIEEDWQEFTTAIADPSQMKEFFEPNLYLYDAYPGGIGFSEPLFHVHDLLLRRTRELISRVPVRERMPVVRGSGRRKEREDQGSCAKTFGASLRMSKTLLDRFARVKALRKPSNEVAQSFADFRIDAQAGHGPERSTRSAARGFSPNIPEGAERLAEILGAKLVQNHFGEHLALRKWFSDVANGVKTDCSPLGHGMADERVDASALRFCFRALRMKSQTHGNGSSWTRKRRGSWAGRGPIRSWLELHGGMPADWKWNNFSCAITATSMRYW